MVAPNPKSPAKSEPIKPSTNLSGMDEIATYARRSKATILDWIRNEGFPAAKLGAVWESSKELIDDWKTKRILAEAHRKAKAGRLAAKPKTPTVISVSSTTREKRW